MAVRIVRGVRGLMLVLIVHGLMGRVLVVVMVVHMSLPRGDKYRDYPVGLVLEGGGLGCHLDRGE